MSKIFLDDDDNSREDDPCLKKTIECQGEPVCNLSYEDILIEQVDGRCVWCRKTYYYASGRVLVIEPGEA